jgi:hypothetical protein
MAGDKVQPQPAWNSPQDVNDSSTEASKETKNGNGIAKEPTEDAGESEKRDKLMNDMVNTGVMGALVGGFALGNLTSHELSTDVALDNVIYIMNVMAVHACTCSALTSAFVYRHINYLDEKEACELAKTWSFLMMLPIGKFAMGCISYMVSVLLLTHRHLNGPYQTMAVVIGVMSIFSVVGVALLLAMLGKRKPRQ